MVEIRECHEATWRKEVSIEMHNLGEPIENLAIGQVIEVNGDRIIAELNPKLTELSRIYAGDVYPIGQFGSIIRIHFGRRIIYALVDRLRMRAEYEMERGVVPSASPDERIVEANLFGEGEWSESFQEEQHLKFERGVANYPLPQQTVYLTPKSELLQIYSQTEGAIVEIGKYVGAGEAPCYADMNELLGKHTAVLGSTGSGKSAAVAAIIHSIMERGAVAEYEKWNPEIIILDMHNEYGSAFPDSYRLSTDDGTLELPYWILNLQETVELIIGKAEFVATTQVNIVKSALEKARQEGAEILGLDKKSITLDSPVPYKLETLIAKIEKAKPDQKSKQDSHNSVLNKLEVLRSDTRMKFMMSGWDGSDSDPLMEIISRIISADHRVRIVDLSGVPNEVAGIASSMIARIIFSIKIWQTVDERARNPVLFICEEAHRYVPNRGEAQYGAAREAIQRIAKEGRKYGIGLLLVSQRPSEIDSTVLSQCNSWIVLRITNETDRGYVHGMLPDSMSGLTKTLSGLRRREAIFVGSAAVMPSRIMIRHLEDDQLPQSRDIDFDKGWQDGTLPSTELEKIAKRWRYQRHDTTITRAANAAKPKGDEG